MTLSYKKGCLIEAALTYEVEAIAHCCNCFCTMKSGIAPQIAKAFPSAEYVDKQTVIGDWEKFGSLSYTYSAATFVFNLYGQYRYQPRNMRHLHYEMLEKSLTKMAEICKTGGVEDIGLPKLGCGLAGGNWGIVSEIIERTLKDFNVTIYVLDEKEIPKTVEIFYE